MILITIMTLLVLSAFYPIPAILNHVKLSKIALEASKNKAVRDRVYDYWYQNNVEKTVKAIGFYTKTFPLMGIWNLALTIATWGLINAGVTSTEVFALTAVSNGAWIVWMITFEPFPEWMKRWMTQIEMMRNTIGLEEVTKRMIECELLVQAGGPETAVYETEIRELIEAGKEFTLHLELLSAVEDDLDGVDPAVGDDNE